MNPYRFMYRLGFHPWDQTPGPAILGPVVEGPNGLPPDRALDVGCGTGRDAVYLAKHGWQVTAVDFVEGALMKARERAAQHHVDVQWITGDASDLGGLGLEPGFTLLYDIGCLHGLPEPSRAGEIAGLTELAAPGGTLILLAFRRGRRVVLPRGMEEEEVIDLVGDAWELKSTELLDDPGMPAPIRRARPTVYRLSRPQRGRAESPHRVPR